MTKHARTHTEAKGPILVGDGNPRESTRFLEHSLVTSPTASKKKVCMCGKIKKTLISSPNDSSFKNFNGRVASLELVFGHESATSSLKSPG